MNRCNVLGANSKILAIDTLETSLSRWVLAEPMS